MSLGFKIPEQGSLDLLSLGALVHRLDPGIIPFRKATEFAVHVSGGEFNVAANLSDCFGLRTGIATAMVDYPIGDLIAEQVRAMGVRPFYKRFAHDGTRGPNMATVYSDRGFGVRPPVVFYNRSNEAGAMLRPGDFDWKAIFGRGVRWFHSGGIFSSLSESTSALVIEAMKAAREAGVITSFDLNYREKLWKTQGGVERAHKVLGAIVENVDVLVGNEEDLQKGLGFAGPEVAASSKLDTSAFLAMIQQVVARFPKTKIVATTLREVHSTNRHSWSAVAWVNGKAVQAPTAELEVLDRVGGGDGFASGFFYGLLSGQTPGDAVKLGWAHGALITTFPGDTTMATLEQVKALAGGGSARIQREGLLTKSKASRNLPGRLFVSLRRMQRLYSWPWVETHVTRTIAVWNRSDGKTLPGGRRYSPREQRRREEAYDRSFVAVEGEARRVRPARSRRIQAQSRIIAAQNRIIAAFARFSATALDLPREAIQPLTDDFLPASVQLARWARRFDATLSTAGILQACRNAWTVCGLQRLLGDRIGLTPAILGYSLLYPYSDNYLDDENVSVAEKLRFSRRFRDRLRGKRRAPQDRREAALWTLIELIEDQYPRARCPRVFDCLLSIHRAQEWSLAQLAGDCDDAGVLRMSCAKGGSSVLAGACLARGWLTAGEGRFSFEWGVLLQLGDDLQDLREDMRHGSATLFSRVAALGRPLDDVVIQLLNFSERVGVRMDRLPNGAGMFKELLRTSLRSLILNAIADSHEFFSPHFLDEAECHSPFRFEFLRERQEKLAGWQGPYAGLFDTFLEVPECDGDALLPPVRQWNSCPKADASSATENADIRVEERSGRAGIHRGEARSRLKTDELSTRTS